MRLKLIFLLFLIILIGCTKTEDEQIKILRVVDGDTLETTNGDKVRLIGINAPEVNEFYYQEAKDELNFLLLNKLITMKSELKSRDKYGRLLRDIYLEDGYFINEALVKNGYAKAMIIEPNHEYSILILQ